MRLLAAVTAALVLAPSALALDCPNVPLEERLESSDAAFVGRVTERRRVGDGLVYRMLVDQRVKGPVGREVEVRSAAPLVDDFDEPIVFDEALGMLARLDGARLVTESCLLTDPGALLSTSDQVRGNAIKIVIGLVILALVLGVLRQAAALETTGARAMMFERVLVVGAGQMGAGIAQVVAASGRTVLLHDSQPGAVERGLEGMAKSLARLYEKGGPAPDEVLARVEPTDALVEADLLIEAIVEHAETKKELFRAADAALPATAVLASNTSSIPITELAAATSRPERVIGMHFFNPVPVLALVEVIRAEQTSDETAEAIVALAGDLGKSPAEANDFPGFVSNRILMPFVNEAAYALMEGVAEAEAIDTVAKLGFAHPMGPLALADLIGLDTCVAIMDVLHQGLGDPKYAPCPLLRRYVAAGRLGRKSGRGFYEYA